MNTSLGMKKINIDFQKISANRNILFGLMLFGALISFEIFNFSTTEFALNDALGNLTFAGVKWATILAIAFCGIDFAGVAKLFSTDGAKEEQAEVWYLFGAWILAAGMNAILTWWGVSIAIADHASQGSSIFANTSLDKAIPVFVAILVWLIRIMIIGTFSVSGEKLFANSSAQGSQSRMGNKNFGYSERSAPVGFAPANNQSVRPHYKPSMQHNNSQKSQDFDSLDEYIN